MNKKTGRYNLAMVIGMYLFLILLLLSIILLVKNIQEIKTDPMIYGMEKHDFNSCTCYSQDGTFTNIVLNEFKIDENKLG